jgi:multidrug efflux pump subunit AcrB
MEKSNPTRNQLLMRKRDPISAFLGRLLSPWMARLFRDHPEDYKQVKESEDKFDDWMRRHLGITNEPPEVWKALLLWIIVIFGFGVLLYVFLSHS